MSRAVARRRSWPAGLATRLRPIDRRDAQVPARRGGPTVRPPSAAAALRAGGAASRHLSGPPRRKVVETVGDGSAFGLEVVYSFDGPQLRGTAGALAERLPLLGPPSSCSTAIRISSAATRPSRKRFEAAGKLALMTVFRNEGQWDTSNVEFHGGRILAYDKVTRTERCGISTTVWVSSTCGPSTCVPETRPLDLAAVYQEMLDRRQLAGFEVTERFYEIGSVAGLEETRTHLSAQA